MILKIRQHKQTRAGAAWSMYVYVCGSSRKKLSAVPYGRCYILPIRILDKITHVLTDEHASEYQSMKGAL